MHCGVADAVQSRVNGQKTSVHGVAQHSGVCTEVAMHHATDHGTVTTDRIVNTLCLQLCSGCTNLCR